jgi:uncharacterized protein involved in exopolysaccharide biosynthesis
MADDQQERPSARTEAVAWPRGYFIALPEGDRAAPGLFDEALRALRASWLVVCLCALAFAGIALGAARFVQPVYLSETLLAQPTDTRTSSALTSLLGQLPLAGLGRLDTSGEQVEALAILRSRAFTEAFIQDEDLRPVLFADKWDPERRAWKVDAPEDVPTLEDAYRMFDQNVRTIVQDGGTGLITLSIEWTDREEAARWANTLVRRVNEHLRQRTIAEAQRSIDYLNRELEKTSIVELRLSIYSLIEEQLSRVVVASTREEYAFRQIDPAAVSDEDGYVWPSLLLMVAVGLAAGAFVGIVFAFMRQSRRSARAERRDGRVVP